MAGSGQPVFLVSIPVAAPGEEGSGEVSMDGARMVGAVVGKREGG